MAQHAHPQFYYPVCTPSNFAALNVNVITSKGPDGAPETLYGAKTTALRELLQDAGTKRETMRLAILRYKYLHNVACAFADPHALPTQRDAFMRIIEALAYSELHEISRTEEIEFSDRPESILKQHDAHQTVHDAALAYVKALHKAMNALSREQHDVMRWNSIDRCVDANGGAAGSTYEVAPLQAHNCPEAYKTENARVHVPMLRWISSSTLAHKNSQYIIISASLQYDYCMAAAVVMFAALNMAESLGQLAYYSSVFNTASNETVQQLSKRAYTAFRKARVAVRQTRKLVHQWSTRPEITQLHAELQPFILDALEHYAHARCIYYREGLNAPIHSPGDYFTMHNIHQLEDDTGVSSVQHLDSSVYTARHFRALLAYNKHIACAIVCYGRQLLHCVEFSSYLHTLSTIALARIVYTETMMRTLQCANDLQDLDTQNRRSMMYDVLKGSVSRIDAMERCMHEKCDAIEVWSAEVDNHTIAISTVPVYGGAVRSSVIGFHLSFIDVRALYRTCANMWDLLHKCKIHVDLLMKHVC